jgi:hypothetical protein
LANRWTRVPDRPVPPLPVWAAAAVPIADIFMLLMASRPRTGSLRRTWVTPATLLLAATATVAGAGMVVLPAIRLTTPNLGVGPVMVIGGLVVLAGALAVALVGLGQRRDGTHLPHLKESP